MMDREFLNDFEEQRAIDEIVEKGFEDRVQVKVWKKQTLAIAASILVFISVTAYAMVREGLEFFRTELETSFIDLVATPLEPIYAEDQGIRFEIVGAGRVGSAVLLYMTMQDMSGEDRLSEELFPDIEIHLNHQEVSTGAGEFRPLHFDEDANTRYFEIRVYVGHDLPSVDTLEVVIERIRGIPQEDGNLPSYDIGSWRMEVAVADTYHPSLIWEGIDLPEHEARIDYMVLDPFGMHVVGMHRIRFEFDVVIEVNYEPIELWGGGCGTYLNGFDCFFGIEEPLDLEEVTAVIFNGYRIEVPE